MMEENPIERRIHVVQGEQAVCIGEPGTMMTTVLGSCVAACIRDPMAGIGGMNHFLLPGDVSSSSDVRYGVYAMEVLINGLLKAGAKRERLEAKLFGGARMLDRISDIGASNARFATSFIENEGIKNLGGSLGGSSARRIQYWPFSGYARQALVDVDMVKEVKQEVAVAKAAPADGGELELF